MDNGRTDVFTCLCAPGWTGVFCADDIQECAIGTHDCSASDNLHCVNTPGSYECVDCHSDAVACECPVGYTGTGAALCVDINECIVSPCVPGAECQNTLGSYTCQCPPGYVPGPTACENFDACEFTTCMHGGECTDLEPPSHDFHCECPLGYTGDVCEINVNECTTGLHTCNLPSEACIDTFGSFQCVCAVGYERSEVGPGCVNIDECGRSTDTCHDNAACTDTAGSFTCSCDPGYVGDGVKCRDYNECLSRRNPCGFNDFPQCRNLNGSYECVCPEGSFFVPPDQCAPIPKNDPCQFEPCVNGACSIDRELGFSCKCDDGWTGRRCSVDINECANPEVCALTGQRCVNTDGSYTCACNPGFQLIKGFQGCVDFNECATGLYCNTTSEVCINLPGTYSCECRPGFYRSLKTGTCTQDNLCSADSNPCGEGETCTTGLGQVSCPCSVGLIRTVDGLCVDARTCYFSGCFNGGSCEQTTKIGYQCKCPTPYYGSRCESKCPDTAPFFIDGKCRECQSDANCRTVFSGSVCDPNSFFCTCANPTPVKVDEIGRCVQCVPFETLPNNPDFSDTSYCKKNLPNSTCTSKLFCDCINPFPVRLQQPDRCAVCDPSTNFGCSSNFAPLPYCTADGSACVACTSDTHCDVGLLCTGNICQRPTCPLGTPCPKGYFCLRGLCFPGRKRRALPSSLGDVFGGTGGFGINPQVSVAAPPPPLPQSVIPKPAITDLRPQLYDDVFRFPEIPRLICRNGGRCGAVTRFSPLGRLPQNLCILCFCTPGWRGTDCNIRATTTTTTTSPERCKVRVEWPAERASVAYFRFNSSNYNIPQQLPLFATLDSVEETENVVNFPPQPAIAGALRGPLEVHGYSDPNIDTAIPAPLMEPRETDTETYADRPFNSNFEVIESVQVDTMVVHNADGGADELEVFDWRLVGLGLSPARNIGGNWSTEGLVYRDIERVTIELGRSVDVVTVTNTSVGQTTIETRVGNDVVRVHNTTGQLRVLMGSDDDLLEVSPTEGNWSRARAPMGVDGGDGHDLVLLDNRNGLLQDAVGSLSNTELEGLWFGRDGEFTQTINLAGATRGTVVLQFNNRHGRRTRAQFDLDAPTSEIENILQTVFFVSAEDIRGQFACGKLQRSRCAPSFMVDRLGEALVVRYAGELAAKAAEPLDFSVLLETAALQTEFYPAVLDLRPSPLCDVPPTCGADAGGGSLQLGANVHAALTSLTDDDRRPVHVFNHFTVEGQLTPVPWLPLKLFQSKLFTPALRNFGIAFGQPVVQLPVLQPQAQCLQVAECNASSLGVLNLQSAYASIDLGALRNSTEQTHLRVLFDIVPPPGTACECAASIAVSTPSTRTLPQVIYKAEDQCGHGLLAARALLTSQDALHFFINDGCLLTVHQVLLGRMTVKMPPPDSFTPVDLAAVLPSTVTCLGDVQRGSAASDLVRVLSPAGRWFWRQKEPYSRDNFEFSCTENAAGRTRIKLGARDRLSHSSLSLNLTGLDVQTFEMEYDPSELLANAGDGTCRLAFVLESPRGLRSFRVTNFSLTVLTQELGLDDRWLHIDLRGPCLLIMDRVRVYSQPKYLLRYQGDAHCPLGTNGVSLDNADVARALTVMQPAGRWSWLGGRVHVECTLGSLVGTFNVITKYYETGSLRLDVHGLSYNYVRLALSIKGDGSAGQCTAAIHVAKAAAPDRRLLLQMDDIDAAPVLFRELNTSLASDDGFIDISLSQGCLLTVHGLQFERVNPVRALRVMLSTNDTRVLEMQEELQEQSNATLADPPEPIIDAGVNLTRVAAIDYVPSAPTIATLRFDDARLNHVRMTFRADCNGSVVHVSRGQTVEQRYTDASNATDWNSLVEGDVLETFAAFAMQPGDEIRLQLDGASSSRLCRLYIVELVAELLPVDQIQLMDRPICVDQHMYEGALALRALAQLAPTGAWSWLGPATGPATASLRLGVACPTGEEHHSLRFGADLRAAAVAAGGATQDVTLLLGLSYEGGSRVDVTLDLRNVTCRQRVIKRVQVNRAADQYVRVTVFDTQDGPAPAQPLLSIPMIEDSPDAVVGLEFITEAGVDGCDLVVHSVEVANHHGIGRLALDPSQLVGHISRGSGGDFTVDVERVDDGMAYGNVENLEVFYRSGPRKTMSLRGTSAETSLEFAAGDTASYMSSEARVNFAEHAHTVDDGHLDLVRAPVVLHSGLGSHILMASDAAANRTRGHTVVSSERLVNVAPAKVEFPTEGRITTLHVLLGRDHDQATVMSLPPNTTFGLWLGVGDDRARVLVDANPNQVAAVFGGPGADVLQWDSAATALLAGGADDDRIVSQAPISYVVGDAAEFALTALDQDGEWRAVLASNPRNNRVVQAPHIWCLRNVSAVLAAGDGADNLELVGGGPGFALGGAGADTINVNATSQAVVLGDLGLVQLFACSAVPWRIRSEPCTGSNASSCADHVYGSPGADVLLGSSDGDRIEAGEGPDLVFGDHAAVEFEATQRQLVEAISIHCSDGGRDQVDPGPGDDVVVLGALADTVGGDPAGHDTLVGDSARVGADPSLVASVCLDEFDGDDTLWDDSAYTYAVGGGGRDTITVGEHANVVGDHTVPGLRTYADTIEAAGHACVLGDNGRCRFAGPVQSASCVPFCHGRTYPQLCATPGASAQCWQGHVREVTSYEFYTPAPPAGTAPRTGDRISVLTGDNLVFAQNDDDTVHGGDGRDLVAGGSGGDTVVDEAGANILCGDHCEFEPIGDGARWHAAVMTPAYVTTWVDLDAPELPTLGEAVQLANASRALLLGKYDVANGQPVGVNASTPVGAGMLHQAHLAMLTDYPAAAGWNDRLTGGADDDWLIGGAGDDELLDEGGSRNVLVGDEIVALAGACWPADGPEFSRGLRLLLPPAWLGRVGEPTTRARDDVPSCQQVPRGQGVGRDVPLRLDDAVGAAVTVRDWRDPQSVVTDTHPNLNHQTGWALRPGTARVCSMAAAGGAPEWLAYNDTEEYVAAAYMSYVPNAIEHQAQLPGNDRVEARAAGSVVVGDRLVRAGPAWLAEPELRLAARELELRTAERVLDLSIRHSTLAIDWFTFDTKNGTVYPACQQAGEDQLVAWGAESTVVGDDYVHVCGLRGGPATAGELDNVTLAAARELQWALGLESALAQMSYLLFKSQTVMLAELTNAQAALPTRKQPELLLMSDSLHLNAPAILAVGHHLVHMVNASSGPAATTSALAEAEVTALAERLQRAALNAGHELLQALHVTYTPVPPAFRLELFEDVPRRVLMDNDDLHVAAEGTVVGDLAVLYDGVCARVMTERVFARVPFPEKVSYSKTRLLPHRLPTYTCRTTDCKAKTEGWSLELVAYGDTLMASGGVAGHDVRMASAEVLVGATAPCASGAQVNLTLPQRNGQRELGEDACQGLVGQTTFSFECPARVLVESAEAGPMTMNASTVPASLPACCRTAEGLAACEPLPAALQLAVNTSEPEVPLPDFAPADSSVFLAPPGSPPPSQPPTGYTLISTLITLTAEEAVDLQSVAQAILALLQQSGQAGVFGENATLYVTLVGPPARRARRAEGGQYQVTMSVENPAAPFATPALTNVLQDPGNVYNAFGPGNDLEVTQKATAGASSAPAPPPTPPPPPGTTTAPPATPPTSDAAASDELSDKEKIITVAYGAVLAVFLIWLIILSVLLARAFRQRKGQRAPVVTRSTRKYSMEQTEREFSAVGQSLYTYADVGAESSSLPASASDLTKLHERAKPRPTFDYTSPVDEIMLHDLPKDYHPAPAPAIVHTDDDDDDDEEQTTSITAV